MRQIFSSQRLENVEGVARLLNENGIETYISDGRSYKGNRRGGFSYSAGRGAGSTPGVWVVKAEDQTRARELLREAGLLESSRSKTSYLSLPETFERERKAAGTDWGLRIKLILLAGIVGMGLMIFGRMFGG